MNSDEMRRFEEQTEVLKGKVAKALDSPVAWTRIVAGGLAVFGVFWLFMCLMHPALGAFTLFFGLFVVLPCVIFYNIAYLLLSDFIEKKWYNRKHNERSK